MTDSLSGKMVGAHPLRGIVRDLSYYGAQVQIAEPLPLYSEIIVAFELPEFSFRAADIYARIVSMRDQGGKSLAGLEFTSLGAETSEKIQLFVQMQIQSAEVRLP